MPKHGRRVFILVTFALILGAWVMTIEAGIVAPRRPVERDRVEWLASYYGASWNDVSIKRPWHRGHGGLSGAVRYGSRHDDFGTMLGGGQAQPPPSPAPTMRPHPRQTTASSTPVD